MKQKKTTTHLTRNGISVCISQKLVWHMFSLCFPVLKLIQSGCYLEIFALQKTPEQSTLYRGQLVSYNDDNNKHLAYIMRVGGGGGEIWQLVPSDQYVAMELTMVLIISDIDLINTGSVHDNWTLSMKSGAVIKIYSYLGKQVNWHLLISDV